MINIKFVSNFDSSENLNIRVMRNYVNDDNFNDNINFNLIVFDFPVLLLDHKHF